MKKKERCLKSSYTNRISESDFLHWTVISFSNAFFVTGWPARYLPFSRSCATIMNASPVHCRNCDDRVVFLLFRVGYAKQIISALKKQSPRSVHLIKKETLAQVFLKFLRTLLSYFFLSFLLLLSKISSYYQGDRGHNSAVGSPRSKTNQSSDQSV